MANDSPPNPADAQEAAAAEPLTRSNLLELLEGISDAFFLMDRRNFIECNRQTLDIFGCRQMAEIIGKGPVDFSPARQPDGKDSAVEARAMMASALAGRPRRFYWRHRRLDGTEFDAEVSLNRVVLEGRIYLQAIVRDITEHRRNQQALRESEEKYRHLFEMESDAIFLIDNATGRIREVNPAASAMYGFTREELLALRNVDLSAEPEQTRQATAGHLSHVPVRYHRRKDGTVFPVEIVARHCTWQGQEVHVAAIRDISFRIEAEKQTRAMQAHLQHAVKMEAIGTLAGGVAHDFNNILQAIRGYGELMQHGGALTPDQDRKLNQILDLTERGEELIQQLLTFSRKLETRKRPTSVHQVVEKACAILERTIPKMIEIRTRLQAREDTLEADAAQLERVIVNLALNARDAMPDGGTLGIETRDVVLDDAFVRSHKGARAGRHLLLQVSDTGCGIAPEILARIFEPFFTTKPRGKGTGLGMAIVYGLVKDHGGYIDCRSTPGRGTAFDIYLPPASAALSEQVDRRHPAPRAPGGSESILVVDDEQNILEIAAEILTAFGYRVISAPDGETAVARLRRQPDAIPLVILDLIMPGMGGRRCLEELKRIAPAVRVIVSSGYSSEDEQEALKGLGAFGFINKPYTMQNLLNTVRMALDA